MRLLFAVLSFIAVVQPCVAEGTLPTAPHIYVEGSASISAAPEIMTVSLAYEEIDESVEKARLRLNKRANSFIESCKALGIVESDVSSTTLSIGPAFEYENGKQKLIGTRVSRRISVTLRDFSKYSPFISAVTKSEVESIEHVRMRIENEKEILSQAQVEALSDAHARANRIATAAGRTLGAVYSISEFNLREGEQYHLSPARSVRESDDTSDIHLRSAGAGLAGSLEPFAPGLLYASAYVYVVYLLE